MAYLQAFSLFLCLAGGLSHSVATPGSSLGHSEEQISGDHAYHLGGETGYEAFPTYGSHSTTLRARDLFDDDEQSHVADILTRRDSVMYGNGRVAQNTGSTKQNEIGKPSVGSSRPPSVAGQRENRVSTLQNTQLGNKMRNTQLGNKIQKTQKWLKSQSAQGSGRSSAAGGYRKGDPGDRGPVTNQEVDELWKRGIDKSTFNQEAQKDPYHEIGTSSHKSIDFNKENRNNFLLQNPEPFRRDLSGNMEMDQDELFVKRAAARKISGDIGVLGKLGSQVINGADYVSNWAVQGTPYKRDVSSNEEVTPDELLIKRAGKSGISSPPKNNYRHGSLGSVSQAGTTNYAVGVSDVYKRAAKRYSSGPRRITKEEARMNFAVQNSDMYKRDLSSNEETALDELFIKRTEGSAPSARSKPVSEVYKRDVSIDPETIPSELFERGLMVENRTSALYKRYLDMDGPELLRRALQGQSGSWTASWIPRRHRRPRPSSHDTSQGSAAAHYEAYDLYKRDPNSKSELQIRSGKTDQSKPNSRPLPSASKPTAPTSATSTPAASTPTTSTPTTSTSATSASTTPASTTAPRRSKFNSYASTMNQNSVDDVYKRDIDSNSDYLTLLLEYLDLQNSDSDSDTLDDLDNDDDDDDESSHTDMDYNSLERLAKTIQTLASKVDSRLAQRAVSPRPPTVPSAGATTRTPTPGPSTPGRRPSRPPNNNVNRFVSASVRVHHRVDGGGQDGNEPW